MARDVVLDASAVLVLLQGESGAQAVAACVPGARISAVNLAEVVGKLAEAGVPEEAIRAALAGLALRVVPLDDALAWDVGRLRASTRARGLSLGDRACLALAAALGLPAMTSDRAWRDLDVAAVVEVVR